MSLAICPPSDCHHAPALQPCEGCRRRVCGPDDGWRTTSGRVYVCSSCLARARRGWMASSAVARA